MIQHSQQQDFITKLLRSPTISKTKRLPTAVFFHIEMRMRFATALQQPCAVQGVEWTVVGFDPTDLDKPTQQEVD